MIQLNGNTHKLQCVMSGAAATTNPDFWASWMQLNTSSLDTGDGAGGTLNGTTDVDLVTGVASRQIIVKSLHVYNRDTAAVTLTFKMDVSGTERFLYACTLEPGQSVSYGEAGWIVKSAAGVTLGPLTASDLTANTFYARSSVGAAVNKTITDQGLALLDDADAETMRDTLKIGPRYCYESFADFAAPTIQQTNLGIEWSRPVTGGSANLDSTAALASGNSYGRATLNLGTTSTNKAAVANTAAHALGAGKAQYNLRGCLASLSDGTDTYVQRNGFMDDVTAEPANGCFFRYTHSVNSGKWQCVTRKAGVETATDSGVTAGAGTERSWRVVVNAAGTSVDFYIDGTIVQTHIANIPTAAVGAASAAIRSAGSAAKLAMTLDVIHVRVDFTTPRW